MVEKISTKLLNINGKIKSIDKGLMLLSYNIKLRRFEIWKK